MANTPRQGCKGDMLAWWGGSRNGGWAMQYYKAGLASDRCYSAQGHRTQLQQTPQHTNYMCGEQRSGRGKAPGNNTWVEGVKAAVATGHAAAKLRLSMAAAMER